MSVRQWGAPPDWGATYEIRIARGDDEPISMEEWSKVVDADEELHWSPENDVELHGDDGTVERLPSVHWQRPSNWDLIWYRGELIAQDPPPDGLDKMVEIAKALDAHVIGEQGERFCSNRKVVERTTGEPTSNRFITYIAAPVLLAFLFAMPFLAHPVGAIGWVVLVVVELLAFLVLVGQFRR